MHSGSKALNLDQNLTNQSVGFSESPLMTGRQEMERISVITVAVALGVPMALGNNTWRRKTFESLKNVPCVECPSMASTGQALGVIVVDGDSPMGSHRC